MTALNDHDTDELTLGRREATAFDVVLRGYDREQVEERLLQWADALAMTEDQRDEALTALKQAEQQSPAHQISDRLLEILSLAEQEAAQIRAEAAAEVKEAVERARSESAEVRENARADLQREVKAAQQEAKRFVAEAKAEAKAIIGSVQAEAEDLAMNTARTREEAQAEHERVIASHRHEQHQVAEQVRQDIVALEQRRDEVREQLERLRDALASSVGSLGQSS